ncbi:hypothetical protein Fot_34254 [Forsythia ovata]|uniref:Uncharacterized protein n=1 Tax=Forsythia ovata TaxID=205694 RepID=A0ABD1SI47_9LAMI
MERAHIISLRTIEGTSTRALLRSRRNWMRQRRSDTTSESSINSKLNSNNNVLNAQVEILRRMSWSSKSGTSSDVLKLNIEERGTMLKPPKILQSLAATDHASLLYEENVTDPKE